SIPCHLSSTLFPYTTLFRSFPPPLHVGHGHPVLSGCWQTSAGGAPDVRCCQAGLLTAFPASQEVPDTKGLAQPGEMNPLRPIRKDRKSTRLNSSHQIISYAV